MKLTLLILLSALASSTAFADLLVSRGAAGVDRYTDNGAFIGNWIAPGAGGLSDAQGVAVSPTGELFVGDFVNENVLRFASNGTFLSVFSDAPEIDNPFDVVFGTDGDLFVASAGDTSKIARLDKTTGAVITGDFTSGNVTPIGAPQYLAFGPSLAVTDIAGHLFRFDPVTGVHISTSILDGPEGVAFNGAGDLFFAQLGSMNVVKIPAGGGMAEIVIPTGAFDGFPADIAFGPNGLLYVSADAIYRFDVSGAGEGVLLDSFGEGGEFLVFASDVPEPGSWMLVLTALACVAGISRARLTKGFRRRLPR